jgi:mRNA-degrading endonuclease RelE of RelBE toxin-antitoxin system
MPYAIEVTDGAFAELRSIKAYHQRRIADAIDEQLPHQPTVETKNRKPLIAVQADFEHREPVWELRVEAYRVYYDVSEESHTVFIRAIREKPSHSTTEQVL